MSQQAQWIHRRAWYVRVAIYCTIGLLAGVSLNLIADRADGIPLALHDPLRPAHLSPAQHTCDDPDDPCYTPSEMASYLAHDAHGFRHLNPDFVFPNSFKHLVIRAHQDLRAKYAARGMASPDAGWTWAGWRMDVHCAGGAADRSTGAAPVPTPRARVGSSTRPWIGLRRSS